MYNYLLYIQFTIGEKDKENSLVFLNNYISNIYYVLGTRLFIHLFHFESGSFQVAETGIEFVILLPKPLKLLGL